MIYLGNDKLGSLYLGSTKIAQAYIGSTQIFSSAPVQYPYLLLLNQTTGGTITADKMSGVPGEIATLSNTPDSYYTFDNYSITGATLTGSQFEFGSTDVTAEATFLPTVYNVTLQTDGHGAIAADKTTGIYGDTITLSQTASAEYNFNAYQITGAVLTGSQFELTGSNVTAKATYTQKVYTLTLQTDGHGTISASKTTGHKGDTVTLSNKYNTYYRFNNYTQTGGSLNGSTFTFGSQNATAKANFKTNNFTASGRWFNSTTSVASGNGAVKQIPYTAVSLMTYKTSNVPAGFYGAGTAKDNAGNSRTTQSAWKGGSCSGYKVSFAAVTRNIRRYTKSQVTITGRTYVGSTQVTQGTATANGATKSLTIPAGNSTTTGQLQYRYTISTTAGYTFMADAATAFNWTATGYAP